MSDDLIIICHDEKALTWDTLDLKLMRDGEKYYDCVHDYCDYERYNDNDIVALTTKIANDWNNVKNKIELTIKNNSFGIAQKMKGFCMIIEVYNK